MSCRRQCVAMSRCGGVRCARALGSESCISGPRDASTHSELYLSARKLRLVSSRWHRLRFPPSLHTLVVKDRRTSSNRTLLDRPARQPPRRHPQPLAVLGSFRDLFAGLEGLIPYIERLLYVFSISFCLRLCPPFLDLYLSFVALALNVVHLTTTQNYFPLLGTSLVFVYDAALSPAVPYPGPFLSLLSLAHFRLVEYLCHGVSPCV
jgi:hypothetical protein